MAKKFTQPLFSIEKQVLNKAQIEAQIRPALELYFSDNKKYPESLYLLVPKYLIKMPLSSSTDISYSYQVSTDGSDYTVNATLEDGSVYKVNAPSR